MALPGLGFEGGLLDCTDECVLDGSGCELVLPTSNGPGAAESGDGDPPTTSSGPGSDTEGADAGVGDEGSEGGCDCRQGRRPDAPLSILLILRAWRRRHVKQ